MTLSLKRDISRLADRTFDVLVIGGGIIGLAIAYDAADRGYTVALIDKGDFGSASSQGCFKIVHGGLRYLQHLDFARLFSSVREQRALRRMAPQIIRPLPILVPCYGFGAKGREALQIGTTFYEALAAGRNEGVDPAVTLPHHRVLSPQQCLEIAPKLHPKGLRGGVVFFDAQMKSSERLSLAFGKSAAAAGAVVCNYVRAVGVNVKHITTDDRVIEDVEMECTRSGRKFRCSARVVVNATGPWAPLFSALTYGDASRLSAPQLLTSEGLQVVLPQCVRGFTVAIESRESSHDTVVSRGARSFFLMPWRGRTLLGTSDTPYRGDPSDFKFTHEAVANFVRSARLAYDDPVISPESVKYVFGGVRPVDENDFWSGANNDLDRVTVSKRDVIVDHNAPNLGRRRVRNLLSVSGIKYTTCRAVAEKIVDAVGEKLGRNAICKTENTPLFGSAIPDLTAFVSDRTVAWGDRFSEDISRHLISQFGTEADEVVSLSDRSPEFREPLARNCDVTGAEVVFCLRHEMVESLSDLLFRRTGLTTVGDPGSDVLERVSQHAARELNWSEERRREEVLAVIEQLRLGLP